MVAVSNIDGGSPKVLTVAKANRERGEKYLDTKGRVGIWNGAWKTSIGCCCVDLRIRYP